jgi:CelD/BcsL family acetyltransferase involved in cellulose biosynthesis
VWLRDQPIAAQFWMVTGQRAEIYKVAYDEAFKAYSPGTVLTARMLEQVIERDRVTEVDYLIGDDPYKKNWMSDRRERWGIVAYNLHNPAGLWALAVHKAKRLAKHLAQRWTSRP